MALIPFDDRDGQIWYDGKMVAWRDAKLHVLTHGLHYASSVFEGERAYGGNIFRLRMHSERLANSARLIGFDIPFSVDTIDAACKAVLAANDLIDAYVRPVAWRGSEQMQVSPRGTTIHVAIAAWAWPNMFGADRMKGVRLDLSRWKRAHPETAPTQSKAAGLYMIGTMAKQEAEAKGFDDAFLLDWRGQLAEASGANAFFAIDGALHTPIPDCMLNGITRQTVIALARRRGIKVVEREMPFSDLDRAQEVFVTGTAAEVTPVRQIGDRNFTPGRITEQLVGDYEALVRRTPAEVEALAA